MAIRKLAITLEVDQLTEIRELVAAGQASSVSGFVKHAVGVALSDAAGWREMRTKALAANGWPLTKKEREWADAILRHSATCAPLERMKVAKRSVNIRGNPR